MTLTTHRLRFSSTTPLRLPRLIFLLTMRHLLISLASFVATPFATKTSSGGTARNLKYFNLETSKWHTLPDFLKSVRDFGPSEITSTQKVSICGAVTTARRFTEPLFKGELEHRRPKSYYPLIHKGKHISQIATRQARERKLKKIRERVVKCLSFP